MYKAFKYIKFIIKLPGFGYDDAPDPGLPKNKLNLEII